MPTRPSDDRGTEPRDGPAAEAGASAPRACVVGHVSVRDARAWAQYRAGVPATLAPWGAEVLFRGTRSAVFDGEHGHTDVVILSFPSAAAARGWRDSPAYRALLPLRALAAQVDLLLFEG